MLSLLSLNKNADMNEATLFHTSLQALLIKTVLFFRHSMESWIETSFFVIDIEMFTKQHSFLEKSLQGFVEMDSHDNHRGCAAEVYAR